MALLIVAATREEILPSIPLLEAMNISYLITGVGLIATAHSLTRSLSKNSYTLIVNVGIAGSFDKKRKLGDTVLIHKDTISELGAEDGGQFIPIDTLGFGTAAWNSSQVPSLHVNLEKVESISVNTVHGNEKSIQLIQERYPDVVLESMEGAAVFYVSAQENVPAIQIRSISNYIEHRNKDTWNIPLAIANLNSWLCEFVKNNPL